MMAKYLRSGIKMEQKAKGKPGECKPRSHETFKERVFNNEHHEREKF